LNGFTRSHRGNSKPFGDVFEVHCHGKQLAEKNVESGNGLYIGLE
jgi:hypothetical protein